MVLRVFFATLLASSCFAQGSEVSMVQAQLNDTYIQAVTSARASRAPEEVQDIKESESKWRAYMNAECKAEKAGDACLVRMSKQRIAELKALYLNGAVK